MTHRQAIFAALAVILFAALLWAAVYSSRRSRRLSAADWPELLDRLKDTNSPNISLLALDLVDERGRMRPQDWPDLPTERVRELVGGLEELEVLQANCAVLIDMAAYVQRSYPQASVVAEELRRNAREVAFHVERLKAAAEHGNLDVWIADYGRRAVASYYLMTKRLLELFEAAHLPELSDLQARL